MSDRRRLKRKERLAAEDEAIRATEKSGNKRLHAVQVTLYFEDGAWDYCGIMHHLDDIRGCISAKSCHSYDYEDDRKVAP